MANSPSAKKSIRQDAKRRARNRWRKKGVRSAIKDLREQILHGSSEDAENAFKVVQQQLDKTAGNGVIHKNAAARTKARLSARVKAKKEAGKG